MSSMRNAAPRRPHRERAQPQARAKWGLLEKHKDYSLRAADYNKKKKKLNILSQKSREKNPDEFAFGMLSSDKAKAGKHGRGDGEKNKLDHKVVQGLKEQDVGHLRTMLSRTRRELQRVTEEIGLSEILKRGINGQGEDKKTTFGADGQPVRKKRKTDSDSDYWSEDADSGDDMEEEKQQNEDDEMHDKAIPTNDSTSSRNQTNYQDEFDDDDNDDDDVEALKAASSSSSSNKNYLQKQAETLARHKAEKRRRRKIREARATKLDILRKRQRSLLAATNEIELQRAKMARTVGGVNSNGVKFKIRERKR